MLPFFIFTLPFTDQLFNLLTYFQTVYSIILLLRISDAPFSNFSDMKIRVRLKFEYYFSLFQSIEDVLFLEEK
jgi:hypothetical protein